MISARAHGQEICKISDEKTLGFLGFYVEIVENTMCFVGFRQERARIDFVVFFAMDSGKSLF